MSQPVQHDHQHSVRLSLTRLPEDIHDYIWDFLSVRDLCEFACISLLFLSFQVTECAYVRHSYVYTIFPSHTYAHTHAHTYMCVHAHSYIHSES